MTTEMLWYFASPYSCYDDDPEVVARILDARFRQVSMDAADLMRMGFRLFAPISHTHPIAEFGNLDHGDHTIWLPADRVIHSRCDGVIVDMIPGWRESHGVTEELKWAREESKSILLYEPKLVLPELVEYGTGEAHEL